MSVQKMLGCGDLASGHAVYLCPTASSAMFWQICHPQYRVSMMNWSG
jgi:hypothetical protein